MPRKKGATLTEITYMGRIFVKFGSLTLIMLMVGRVALNTSIALWKAMHPAPPPPPTVGFGAMPQLRFPQRVDIDKPTTYILETANGVLPDFGDRAKVFFMPQSALGLLDDEDAKKIAATYGYLFEPEIHNVRMYRWTKSTPIASTLQVDIQSLSFQVTTDYLARPELLTNPNLPDSFEAVTMVKRFLSRVEEAEDLATASGEIVYQKSLGGELAEAVSYSDADFISVDLNRVPIDEKFRMFTPEGYKGTVHAVITGAMSGNDGLVHFENNYHHVDYEQIHTYPLRSPQSAWQILKAGEGYLAGFEGTTGQAVIRTVQLGYYDDFEEQEYLQPIYVFEGDDNFIGYVSALDPLVVQAKGRLK